MAKIEWSEEAARDLERLDRQVVRRILRKLDWFSKNFVRVILEPLAGEFKGTYKLRVGDWRVIYTIEGEVVRIWSIGHRKEIYYFMDLTNSINSTNPTNFSQGNKVCVLRMNRSA